MTIKLIIETQDPEIKANERQIERIARIMVNNYVAATAGEVDSQPYFDIARMIQDKLEVKVVWEK